LLIKRNGFTERVTIMSIENKLEEAKYFFLRMKEELCNRQSFVFNLSAFLSASRSVLQYLYNDVDLAKNPKAQVVQRLGMIIMWETM